ncbi:UNVERIFIED_CONTAM: hypothetical protein K2H54_055168 [Gekko kuhli]
MTKWTVLRHRCSYDEKQACAFCGKASTFPCPASLPSGAPGHSPQALAPGSDAGVPIHVTDAAEEYRHLFFNRGHLDSAKRFFQELFLQGIVFADKFFA